MRHSFETFTLVLTSLAALPACGAPEDSGLFEVQAASRPTGSELSEPPPGSPDAEAVSPPNTAQLLVRIREVRVHSSDFDYQDEPPRPEHGAPGGGADVEGDIDGWHTVFSGERTLDLLDEHRGPVFLGSLPLPEGNLTQLRLVLSNDVIYQTPNESSQVRCPSCRQSGLKVPLQGLHITAGRRTRATLWFSADQALWSTPQGYVLSPVIRAELDTQP